MWAALAGLGGLALTGTGVILGDAEGAWAAVHPVKSLYTTVDLAHCTSVRSGSEGNAWRCVGLPGFPLYVAEGDGRTFVGVGEKASSQRAGQQTLHAFNTPFEKHSGRMTVEWRFVRHGGHAQPYAMIVRYFTTADDARGEVLVVTRIDGEEACHVAYIDALANRDAIVLARQLADGRARAFDCKVEPGIEGETGRSPM